MIFHGFTSCQADPDIWMRSAENNNGEKYFEYVLLYVDDCLAISHRSEDLFRNEIREHFELKDKSIGPPSQYLGGKMREIVLEYGAKA